MAQTITLEGIISCSIFHFHEDGLIFRFHELSHTFVCHQLYRWAKEEVDLMVMLPVLSKYLGHTGVLSTQWYLRLTAEAYPEVTETMDSLTGCVFPEIGGELLEETD